MKKGFINKHDKFENTPLLCACFKQKEDSGDQKRVDLITILIEN